MATKTAEAACGMFDFARPGTPEYAAALAEARHRIAQARMAPMPGDAHQATPDAANAAEMIRAAGYTHPAEVIEEQAAELARLRRHADIAAGLLETPQAQRGAAWHLEADGVLRTLANKVQA